MPWRRQLPAYSPVTLRSLAAGLGAMVRPDAAREELGALICREFGTQDVLLVDSGTSALRLGLAAAREAGREPVALPAYSCFDVATAADGADVGAVLYDVDPSTLGPDMDSLRAALQAGARAVVVAHLYGIPVDLAAVREMARDHDALLIEDAAQGVGASFEGRPLGSHGSLAVLSFGRGKGWTGGGGGALLANDQVGLRLLTGAEGRTAGRVSRSRGGAHVLRLAAQGVFGRPSLFGLPASIPSLGIGATRYRAPHPPERIVGSCARAVAANRRAALAEAAERREQAARWSARIRAIGLGGMVAVPAEGTAGWLRFPLLADSRAERDRLTGRPGRALGVMPGYPKALGELHPFAGRLAAGTLPCPGAGQLAKRLLTLPTHSRLAERDVRRLDVRLAAAGGDKTSRDPRALSRRASREGARP